MTFSFDISAALDSVTGGAGAATGGGHYELHLAGIASPTVVHLRGREEISKPFSFSITVVHPASTPLLSMGLVGRPATLLMRLPGKTTRVVQGIVASIAPKGLSHPPALQGYEIRLVPRLWLLKWRRTSRVFQNMDTPSIVAAVLNGASVANRSVLSRSYPVRSYCLQYQETDLQFVQRLLAEEGI
jgi:type VI secretion system secreted protein VgrG